jgi:glycosyltransferase involved in cell wall biosynthesis
MKILMVLDHEYPPDIRVEKEIHSLCKEGHDVHLACIGDTGTERTKTCTIHRKRISKFVYKASVACLTLPFYFAFWRTFVNEILRESFEHLFEDSFDYTFDAIHIHDLPLARIGWEMKKRYGVRFVLDLHENWPYFVANAAHTNTRLGRILSPVSPWKCYEKEMVEKADEVITVVEEMRDRIGRGMVVPNTVKIEPEKQQIILLYYGGIDNQRGLEIPIEAMSELVNRLPVKLWIVGSGRYESVLKVRVKDLWLENFVVFFGAQNGIVSELLIKEASIAIIPYPRTVQTDCCSPNKLFQYMHFGIPVLASDCISIKRILDETGAGVCYKHDSIDDFVKKVIWMVSSKSRNHEMWWDGIRSASKKYNWDNTSKDLFKIYVHN